MSEHLAHPTTMEPLIVPGNLDALAQIGQYVLDAAATAGLDKKSAYRLRLAVDEIATNIITHGYDKAGLTGAIELHVQIDAQALTLILEDSGPPFDPRQHDTDDLGLDLPLEARNIGGLGVFLALSGVDQFHYEYVAQRNRNVFVMHRPHTNAQ